MEGELLGRLASLRLAVGWLGEQAPQRWWNSGFASNTSKAFLLPVFPRTALLAQYHGLREAAARIHDEHIGLGQVYHLFRLPEEVEQELHRLLAEEPDRLPLSINGEVEQALAFLASQCAEVKAAAGPVRIGEAEDLQSATAWDRVSSHYAVAFRGGAPTYPYFSRRA